VFPGSQSLTTTLFSFCSQDLPKDVTPLLRDPRQTSRTGGNSKRHVYAYRGVCRQARKGHDRWQSQISFSGTNHYLGTFGEKSVVYICSYCSAFRSPLIFYPVSHYRLRMGRCRGLWYVCLMQEQADRVIVRCISIFITSYFHISQPGLI